jgi:hypothetical protein
VLASAYLLTVCSRVSFGGGRLRVSGAGAAAQTPQFRSLPAKLVALERSAESYEAVLTTLYLLHDATPCVAALLDMLGGGGGGEGRFDE